MSDLAEFLLARIAEDEAAVGEIDGGFDFDPRARESSAAEARGLEWFGGEKWSDDYRLAVPSSRVLAECEAKRRIVDMYREHDHSASAEHGWSGFSGGYATATDHALAILALPYADHPDYRSEWRP